MIPGTLHGPRRRQEQAKNPQPHRSRLSQGSQEGTVNPCLRADTYTSRQAAEMLDICQETVLRAIRQGRLPARRDPDDPLRTYLIPKESLEAYRPSARPRKSGERPCARCGRIVRVLARGFCSACYKTHRYQTDPDYREMVRACNRRSHRKCRMDWGGPYPACQDCGTTERPRFYRAWCQECREKKIAGTARVCPSCNEPKTCRFLKGVCESCCKKAAYRAAHPKPESPPAPPKPAALKPYSNALWAGREAKIVMPHGTKVHARILGSIRTVRDVPYLLCQTPAGRMYVRADALEVA